MAALLLQWWLKRSVTGLAKTANSKTPAKSRQYGQKEGKRMYSPAPRKESQIQTHAIKAGFVRPSQELHTSFGDRSLSKLMLQVPAGCAFNGYAGESEDQDRSPVPKCSSPLSWKGGAAHARRSSTPTHRPISFFADSSPLSASPSGQCADKCGCRPDGEGGYPGEHHRARNPDVKNQFWHQPRCADRIEKPGCVGKGFRLGPR